MRQPANFRRDLAESHGLKARWETFYRAIWPDLSFVAWADDDMEYQKAGIDALVFLPFGSAITIDEKYRKKDYGDFLAEVWNDRAASTPGWTWDPKKKSHFVAYAIRPAREAVLLERQILRDLCLDRGRRWCEVDRRWPRKRENEKDGRRWWTWNVAVPWSEVESAVKYRGTW